MDTKQRKTLQLVFVKPVPSSVPWGDILSLFRALDATIGEGKGSRVHVELNGHDATFHTPHPCPVADQGRVRAVREFLAKAGVTP